MSLKLNRQKTAPKAAASCAAGYFRGWYAACLLFQLGPFDRAGSIAGSPLASLYICAAPSLIISASRAGGAFHGEAATASPERRRGPPGKDLRPRHLPRAPF